MRRFLTLLYIFVILPLCGQDLITTVRGQKITGKIISVERQQNSIIYQAEGSKEKSAISINHVKSIKFSNGKYEEFGEPPFKPSTKPRLFDSTRHFISIDIIPLFMGLFALSYEYILDGHTGLRARVAFGKGEPFAHYYRQSTKQSYGLDVNFYPFEGNFFPGRGKFFIGPSIEYGTFMYEYPYYNYRGDTIIYYGAPPYQTTSTEALVDEYQVQRMGFQFNFMVKTGILWRFSKHVNASFVFGLGRVWFNPVYKTFEPGQQFNNYRVPHYGSYKNRFTARFEINLGIKLGNLRK